MGIEPTLSAWEADALPLSYTRVATAYSGGCSVLQQTSVEYSIIILVQQDIFVNHKGLCFPAFFILRPWDFAFAPAVYHMLWPAGASTPIKPGGRLGPRRASH